MDVGIYNATRLVRTEVNHFANEAEMLSYEELDVEKYRYIATLDKRTCDRCGELDNKVFNVKDKKHGKNCPPLHANDRCTTVAVFDDDTIEGPKRIARDPVTGKNYYIDQNISYEEWKKEIDNKYGKGTLEKQQKMYKNTNSDKLQYDKYKETLGKEKVPKSFAKFQELKYNKVDEWKKLKLDYSDAKGIYSAGQANEYIKNVPKKLLEGQQGKHIKGHNNYKDGNSIVTLSNKEIEELYERYAGKGEKRFDKNGCWIKTEKIKTDKVIGEYINKNRGTKITTNSFTIKYSKNGYHIVPANN